MKPEDLTKVRDGAIIANFLPYIEKELETIETGIRSKAYIMLGDGSMTPEAAMYFWMELYTVHRLRKRFQQHVKVGQSAGVQLEGLKTGY